MLRLITAALAISLATEPALASAKYLCIADKATGFSWTGSEWAPTTFKVEKDKFVIADLPADNLMRIKDPTLTIGVTGLGKLLPSYFCKAGPVLECIGPGGDMRIDLTTLRFMSWYLLAYTNGEDDNDDTPSIEIGRCTKM
jgi:hypothetical protein